MATRKTKKKSPKRQAKKRPAPSGGNAGTKVLVTGAGGFVGGVLLKELLDRGYRVRATDLPRADLSIARGLGLECIPSDLLDLKSMERVVDGVDRIIHTAACFDLSATRETAYAVNVTGTRNLCLAAADAGVERLVYFSSTGVYGDTGPVPAREDHLKAPGNDYYLTKWWGEKEAWKFHRDQGLPVVVLRPTVIYGPRGVYSASVFFALIGLLLPLGLKKIHGLRGGLLSHWAHVEDVAGAAAFLVGAPEAVGHAYNIADDTPTTVEEFMSALVEAYGMEYQAVLPFPTRTLELVAALGKVAPSGLYRSAAGLLQRYWDRIVLRYDLEPALFPRPDKDFIQYIKGNYVYSNEAIKALGYTFRHPSFREGFRETVQWYKENRWIPDL